MTIRHTSNVTQMRSETLALFRSVAILGQVVTLLIVWTFLKIDLPYAWAFAIILIWVVINIAQVLILPGNHRFSERLLIVFLLVDMIEMTGLLYLTGGVHNLFMFFIAVPVFLAANLLQRRYFMGLAGLAVASFIGLSFFHLPLKNDDMDMHLQPIMALGHFVAATASMLFISFFTRRITNESLNMTKALAASELALQRELRLSSLGGLVAAYAHELGTPLANIRLAANDLIEEDLPKIALEDARLIKDEVVKISEILNNMGRIGKDDILIQYVPFSALLDEAARPHKDRGIVVDFEFSESLPLVKQSAAIVHGLRNLIQNAVDFANTQVVIQVSVKGSDLLVRICDDGDGFAIDILNQIGEPYLKSRHTKERAGYQGMGLGLFISKQLLEASGARVFFGNKPAKQGKGAIATVSWRLSEIEIDQSEARRALGENKEQVQ